MESTMATELRELMLKARRIAAQRDETAAALKRALEEIADLKAELELTKEELHSRELDVEFLTVSHKLADKPQALAEARQTVKRMIAGVDRAMALLKSDAAL